jgi:hypothetical protein
MGDGALVYFGYPQAHEDDAEQAVRAGLELIAAVAGFKTRASLQTRVGIATGLCQPRFLRIYVQGYWECPQVFCLTRNIQSIHSVILGGGDVRTRVLS